MPIHPQSARKLTPVGSVEYVHEHFVGMGKQIRLEPITTAILLGSGGTLNTARKVKVTSGEQADRIWWVVKQALHPI